MVAQESVNNEQTIDIALNIYTFKKASLLQSSVIAFLSRLKSDSEELNQLRKVFTELNTSQSGFLSAEELKAGTEKFKKSFARELGKNREYEPNWEKLIEYLDVDKDKKLGFDEFVTAATNRTRLITGEGYLRKAFDILDIDKDGLVSIEELKHSFAQGSIGSGF